VVSETQIERISGLGSVENGPTGASCYIGGLQSMSHYGFSIPFFPFFGGGRHQEEKEAALVAWTTPNGVFASWKSGPDSRSMIATLGLWTVILRGE
jgi:hypothetical protein